MSRFYDYISVYFAFLDFKQVFIWPHVSDVYLNSHLRSVLSRDNMTEYAEVLSEYCR